MAKLAIIFLVFIFGTFWGSFLNAVIYRLKVKKSFLGGRSFCPLCNHQLGFFDLIPILSFILLGGKCRYCKGKISFQYPLVETGTGVVFSLIFWRLERAFQLPLKVFVLEFLYFALISSFLIIVFSYDWRYYLIPDKAVFPAITIVFLYRLFIFSPDLSLRWGGLSGLKTPLLSALGASGFFFLIWLVSRGKWMGFGDVKLAFLMGLFLGFPLILPALFSAFFIGAIIGLALIALGKKKMKSEIPFAPFLVAGTFLALFFGDWLIEGYFNLILR
jgi:prepilin signal peptidase PulO-like enzyme (type II secretory pathway)